MTTVLADVIARSIHAANAPLLARIAALESKAAVPGPQGPAGADIDPIFVKSLVAEAVGALPEPKQGEKGDKGADGKSVDEQAIRLLVETAVKALPTPKDGARGEDGKSVDLATVKTMVAEAVSTLTLPKGEKGEKGDSIKGETGPAGKDADPLQLKSLQDEVTRLREEVIVLKSVPAPKDGTIGPIGPTGPKGDPGESVRGEKGETGPAGSAGAKGDTGHSVASALVNKDGCLVLTFSDGTVKDVGVVVGKDGTNGTSVDVHAVKSMVLDAVAEIPKPKDGTDGKDGASVDMAAVEGMVAKAVDTIPKPTNGTNGVDGLGFDDLDVAFDEQTGVVLRFVRGAVVKEFPVAVPFDAGVWKSGTTYPKGAGVTVKGAFFIAREQTQTRPDDGTPESARAWRLAVKGGRDGKPGKDGKDGSGA